MPLRRPLMTALLLLMHSASHARVAEYYGIGAGAAVPVAGLAEDLRRSPSGVIAAGSIVHPRLAAGLHVGGSWHPARYALDLRAAARAGVPATRLVQQIVPIGIHGRVILPGYDSRFAVEAEAGASEYFLTLRSRDGGAFPTERRGRPGVHAAFGLRFGRPRIGIGVTVACHNIFDSVARQYVTVGLGLSVVPSR